MTIEIKRTMLDNNLINEAEMFCTDLEFRADDQGNIHDYIGDLAKKQDDVVRNIHECLSYMVQQFKKVLKLMVNEDLDAG